MCRVCMSVVHTSMLLNNEITPLDIEFDSAALVCVAAYFLFLSNK